MPRLIYKLEPGGQSSTWEGLVLDAVRAGYRGIDLAGWPTQISAKPGVSSAFTTLFASGVMRESMFIQTKVIPHYASKAYPGVSIREQVEQSIAYSLKKLGLTYIDSLLLAGPYPVHEQTMEAWRAMEDAVRAGLVRQLGIASTPLRQIFRLNADATITPAVVYQRAPGWKQLLELREMRAWCDKVGAWLQPTGMPYFKFDAVTSIAVQGLSEKYGVSSSLLLFRYAMGLNVVPLISSVDKHMDEYHAAMRVPLTEQDAEVIGELLRLLDVEEEGQKQENKGALQLSRKELKDVPKEQLRKAH